MDDPITAVNDRPGPGIDTDDLARRGRGTAGSVGFILRLEPRVFFLLFVSFVYNLGGGFGAICLFFLSCSFINMIIDEMTGTINNQPQGSGFPNAPDRLRHAGGDPGRLGI